jgi:hypothetical protein
MSARPSRAPSPTLPLGFLGVAVLAFVLAGVALPWLASDLTGHYYHPRLLALTHTLTLGWITLAILGASYPDPDRPGAARMERAARPMAGVDRVEVVLAFDPPWTPDRIRR